MKKIVVGIMMLLLCFSVTGCAKKNEHGLSAKEPQTITIWHYYNGVQAIAFDELVMNFNNTVGMEKGIVVNSVGQGSIDDLVSALRDSSNKVIGAADMPNIFQSYSDVASEFDEMGVLANMEPYMTQEEKDKYITSYLQEGYIKNDQELKLFPVAKSSEVLIVNKTMWDKFAADTGAGTDDLATWEGLARTAEKYYEWSDGKAFFGRDAFANYMLIGSKQQGKEIFQVTDGAVTLDFDRDAIQRLWDNYYVPYINGYYKHVGRYRSDDIKTGEIIAHVAASTGSGYLPNEITVGDDDSYPVEYMVLPVPNFEGTEKCVVQQGASMAITKTDETKEYASMVFLQWLAEPEQNIGFCVNSGYLPVQKAANDKEAVQKYIEEHGLEIGGVALDCLMTSIDQVNSYELYTSKGFENGYEAREVLNTSMINLAMEDRKSLDEMKNGTDKEAAKETYLTGEYFNQWYELTLTELEKLCTPGESK
ncbi:extracellular solute-binding protein [Anaerolentibacter hominis]|uniref:extracellular solute-binding protein n=1 Tax=Anaerolentibacter hominis TaxID=3079009 RepID=UPI0031B887E4